MSDWKDMNNCMKDDSNEPEPIKRKLKGVVTVALRYNLTVAKRMLTILTNLLVV